LLVLEGPIQVQNTSLVDIGSMTNLITSQIWDRRLPLPLLSQFVWFY